MTITQAIGFAAAVICVLSSSASHAAEAWDCEYSAYRPQETKQQSFFRLEGNRLAEYSGDAITGYQVLENSETAIVAAKGGSYASEPRVMGFLVLIKKDTGDFILVTASIGELNGSQTGHCRRIEGANLH